VPSQLFLHLDVRDVRLLEDVARGLVAEVTVELLDGGLGVQAGLGAASLAGLLLDCSHQLLPDSLAPAGFEDGHALGFRHAGHRNPETGRPDGSVVPVVPVSPGRRVCDDVEGILVTAVHLLGL
jgi:hypothetical protein